MKRFTSPLLSIGLLLLASGCAGAVPYAPVAATDSLICAAEEMGAPTVPQATLYLQLAKDENAHAQRLLDRGSTAAKGQLMRAQADAELGFALANQ